MRRNAGLRRPRSMQRTRPGRRKSPRKSCGGAATSWMPAAKRWLRPKGPWRRRANSGKWLRRPWREQSRPSASFWTSMTDWKRSVSKSKHASNTYQWMHRHIANSSLYE
eukprot:scaffold194604_cov40-Prasinocladus_malaysianus.AAC.1